MSALSNVGGFFKKISPFISGALSLGGPVGALAGTALSVVTGIASGGKTPTDLQGLAEVFVKSPDQQKFLADLKAAEQSFAVQMKQLDVNSVEELEKLAVDDRANARALQVTTRSWTAPILAWFVVLSFALAVWLVLTGHGKVEAAFAGTLIGYLAANAQQVISYFFGSSAGSDRKTEILAGSSPK